MLELLRSGVFLNPMGTKLYLSLAHDDAALEEFAERLRAALKATGPGSATH
jgi:glutamate-1-semialdehyde 2,1-aminomutase